MRAFLPLFYLSAALHYGLISKHAINPHFLAYVNIVSSDSTFYLLLALAVVEVLLEKSVALDEALDLPLLLCRIVCAVAISFAVITIRDLETAVATGIVTGIMGALPIINLQVKQHSEDAARLPGYVNFASSLLVDSIALIVSAMAIQMPYAGLVILHPAAWLSAVFLGHWRSKLTHHKSMTSLPPPPEFPTDIPGAGARVP